MDTKKDGVGRAEVLGAAVRGRRRELSMTQREFAARLSTSQMQLWRIESGLANPTLRTIQRIEDALSFSLLFEPAQRHGEEEG